MRTALRFVGRLLPGSYRSALRSFPGNARRYLLTAALQNVGYGVIGTVFAIHLKDRGFSEAVVGDVEGALAFAAAAICLLLPPLVGTLGYRRLMMVAAISLGAARAAQAFAPSALGIVGLGLLFGVGDGIMQTLSTAFMSENGGRRRTALFTADFIARVSAMFAGSLIGGGLPMWLRPMIGSAEAFRVTIVVAAALMVLSAIPAAGIREPEAATRGLRAWFTTLKGFRSWDRLRRLLVPEMLISFGAGLVMPFVAIYLKHQLGATVGQVGIIQAASSVTMAVGALATPYLARRLGLAGTVVLTELASLPFLVAIPLSSSLPVVAGLFLVRGALMNMSWPVYNQLSMEGLPAADKPLVAGWVRFGWSIAWLGGSALGGRLMQHSYTIPWLVTAVLYAMGALATYLLLRRVVVAHEADARDAA